jgi:cytochrome c biogenesis protein ResB
MNKRSKVGVIVAFIGILIVMAGSGMESEIIITTSRWVVCGIGIALSIIGIALIKK